MRNKIFLIFIVIFSMFLLVSCDKTTNVNNGKSAYEIAVDNGFVGTEKEWLESLKGIGGSNGSDGINGQNGKSAYEIAVENGFAGTEVEWLESLKGINGTNGTNGQNGKGIKSTEIDENGDLIITYTDDTIVNAGHIETKVEESELDFYPLTDGTYGVKAGRTCYLENVMIPETYKGKKVSTILPNAFKDAENLKTITIPDTITNICEYAFNGCKALSDIVLPNELVDIGDCAFCGCGSLYSIIIPEKVEKIAGGAFYNCNHLAEIYNLSSVRITFGTIDYSYNVDHDCVVHTSLDEKSVIVKENEYVFAYMNNTGYIIDYLGDGKKLVLPSSFKYDNQTINIKNIFRCAFFDDKSLESLVIPDGIENIGSNAFASYPPLKCLILPKTIKIIEKNAISSSIGKVYFKGTQSDKDNITIENNYDSTIITWFYFTSNGANETASGNWWYYDSDGATVIEKDNCFPSINLQDAKTKIDNKETFILILSITGRYISTTSLLQEKAKNYAFNGEIYVLSINTYCDTVSGRNELRDNLGVKGLSNNLTGSEAVVVCYKNGEITIDTSDNYSSESLSPFIKHFTIDYELLADYIFTEFSLN